MAAYAMTYIPICMNVLDMVAGEYSQVSAQMLSKHMEALLKKHVQTCLPFITLLTKNYLSLA